jgi:hypothetical protein
LADSLRKRENFLYNVGGNIIKPVRRPYESNAKTLSAIKYLPWKHCFGMFKKNYLSPHIKICTKDMKNKAEGKCQAQLSEQNMLVAFT